MSEEHEWAVIHQRGGAYYHWRSVNGDNEGGEPWRLALYQRLAADHYRAARRFMGLEGWE